MISLISTAEPLRIRWLPQFVRHYRALGVDRFFLSLQLEPDEDPALKRGYKAQFRETLAALGIEEAFFLEKSFDAYVVRDHHDEIQDKYISPDDWVVWCDSDEYQAYPRPLAEMVAKWESEGCDYVNGLMLDRVAADGSLPRFDPSVSVWEQFPIACTVAGEVSDVLQRKIAMARGDVFISRGNHFLACAAPAMLTPTSTKRLAERPPVRTPKPFANWVQIHHFKWDANVIELLRFRLTPQWRAKCPWWVESGKLLDYFEGNGGRFNLDDLKVMDVPNNVLLAGIMDRQMEKPVDAQGR